MDRFRQLIQVAAAALLCAAATAAQAGELRGLMQFQYQQLEDVGPKGNSTRRSFLQTYELNHTTRLGGQLDLSSQIQVSRANVVGGQERTTTPIGSVRLVHPMFALFTSYRPISVRGTDGLTSRQQETQVSGYLGKPGLPRLDLSWIRRHLDPRDLAPGDTSASSVARSRATEATSITRNARMTHEAGLLSLRAGYGDQTQEAPNASVQGEIRTTRQKSYDAGASLRLPVAEKLAFLLQYDYGFNQRTAGTGTPEQNRNHSVNVSGGQRVSRKLDWNLNYSFRRSELRGASPTVLTDHDGSVVLTWHPSRGTTVLSGTGVRTARTADRQDVLGYALVSATAEGRVRPGWLGTANATRSWNRFPDGQTFWVDSYHAGSRLTLARGLDLTGDMQVSANGDTAALQARVVSQLAVGLVAIPLHGIYLGMSSRLYRAGPSLAENPTRTNSTSYDVRWTPGPVDVSFNHSSSGALPHGEPTVTTTTLNLGWRPSQKFQATASYSNSNQTRTTSGLQPQVGREVLSGRFLAALSRTVRLVAGISAVDPYRSSRSRAMDVSLTKSFGR